MINSDIKNDQTPSNEIAKAEELNADDLDQVVGGNLPFPDVGSSTHSTSKKVKGELSGGASSDGDEPGTSKGVVSSKNISSATASTGSVDIKMEGNNMTRHLDQNSNDQD